MCNFQDKPSHRRLCVCDANGSRTLLHIRLAWQVDNGRVQKSGVQFACVIKDKDRPVKRESTSISQANVKSAYINSFNIRHTFHYKLFTTPANSNHPPLRHYSLPFHLTSTVISPLMYKRRSERCCVHAHVLTARCLSIQGTVKIRVVSFLWS